MKWSNIINNPKTSFGAVMALVGIGLCLTNKSDAGVALIGAASVWIGITGKDLDK